jgi:hypothetical protein
MNQRTFMQRAQSDCRWGFRQSPQGCAGRLGVRAGLFLCAGFYLLALANPVSAQSALVTAEMARSSPPARSGAPVTIVWKLKSASTGLVEGKLDLRVFDGPELLAHLVSDDIVLTGGELRIRTILPPLDTNSPLNGAEIRLKLVRKQDELELGTPLVRLPKTGERAFVVANCDSWQTTPSQEKQLFLQQFRFETYNSETTDRTISTNLSHVRSDEMPADPLGYCGFDLVILVDEGFVELNEAQLRALSAWVSAGGSLCVAPGRQVLKEHHLAFLNELAANLPHDPLLLDSAGRLITPEPAIQTGPVPEEDAARSKSFPADAITLKRAGLGRLALILGDVRQFSTAPEPAQRRLLAFLWKMRKEQSGKFVSEGGLDFVAEAIAMESGTTKDGQDVLRQLRPNEMRLAPLPLQTGDQLLGRLMPRDLRIVPLGLIALFLLVYLAVIGPGDYLLLGALKRRRYTWILFPAVTVAFAIGIVAVSNWYMRVADNRRAVTVFDVNDTGATVRRNRFEVLFRDAPREVVTEVTREIHTAMNHQRFSSATWYNLQTARNRGTENLLDLVTIPEYSGQVPRQYTVTQFIPQWTPQLNRRFAIANTEALPAFDWASLARLPISAGKFPLSPEVREAIAREVRTGAGTSGSAYVLQGSSIYHVMGRKDILQGGDSPYGISRGVTGPVSAYRDFQNRHPTSFLQDICSAAPQGGLFSIVSQISPTGGADFEDLSLLDPTDPNQWLLVVIVEREDELLVYRRLYTGEL